MVTTILLERGARLVDLTALRAAIGEERLAGIRLVEPLRSRVLRLVSRLAGTTPITANVLLRFLPPLLEGLSEDPAEFHRELERLVDRLSCPGNEQTVGHDVPPRFTPGGIRRKRILKVLAGFAAALLILAVGALWRWPLTAPPTPTAQAPIPSPSAIMTPAAKSSTQATKSADLPKSQIPATTLGVPLNGSKAQNPGATAASAEWTYRSTNWSLAGVLLILALAILINRIRRAPLALERFPTGQATSKIAIQPSARRTGLDPRWIKEWRSLLGKPAPGEARLDLEATIGSTVEQSGFVTLRYRLNRGLPNFTAIVERDSRRDCLADWWLRVFAAVASSGVDLQIGSTRRTSSAPSRAIGKGIAATLQDPTPNSRLLIFGAASSAMSGLERSTWSGIDIPVVIASAISGVTLREGGSTRQTGDLVQVARGIETLTGYHDADPASSAFLFDPDRNWMDETPASASEWQLLKGALILRLEPDGYRWLSACAVFPMIEERLAWRVGQALGLSEDTVASRRHAIQLFSTPWMRAGRFPRWLRDRLTDELGGDDVSALHRLLISQLDDRTPSIAVMADDAAIVGREAKGIDLDDSLLARFIVSPPGQTALTPGQLPPHLRAWLTPKLSSRIVKLAGLRQNIVPTVLTACAILLLLPPSPSTGLLLAGAFAGAAILGLVAPRARATRLSWLSRRAKALRRQVYARRRDGKAESIIARQRRARARRETALSMIRMRLMMIMLLYTAGIILVVTRIAFLGLTSETENRTDYQGPVARGEIVDRNGSLLASTVDRWLIAVRPNRVIGDKRTLAGQLARIMPNRSAEDYYQLLLSPRAFIYLRHGVAFDVVSEVNMLGEPGLVFTKESVRLYPQSSLAAHVIGYVGSTADNFATSGRSGIERAFEDRLNQRSLVRTPVALSIDSRVQAALESELGQAFVDFRAKDAVGIVLDVDTGEVIAMTSLPSYNPNKLAGTPGDALRNNATQSVYELGGTFKPITIAAAIENGVMPSMDKRYDASLPLRVGRFEIHDDAPQNRWLNVPETLVYSSNIATARIAAEIGQDRLAAMFRGLDFDRKTSLELRELGRPIWPTYWGQTTVMTAGYGHGLAVTPLHLANAYAVLVNGGILRPATLLKTSPTAAPTGRRVLSEATSARMRQLLRLVVSHGTGKSANAPGMRVGGKTGTAEIPTAGGYSKNANVSTFVAAFPMDRPRYVVLAMLNSPVGNVQSAGQTTAPWTAAPVVGRVISRIGPMLGVYPDTNRDVDVSTLLPLLYRGPAGDGE